MLGIIGLCLLPFICILLSMSCSLPAHTKVRKGIERMVADFKLVFYLHWLSHWICKFF
jgi:hypothetical protein